MGGANLGPRSLSTIITVAIVIGVMMLRNSKPRPLRIERLWIRPVIFLALLVSAFAAAPPPLTAATVALIATGLAAGCALGWQRGRFMRIEVHPETHDITSRASPLGIIFILVLVVVRIGMRGAIAGGGAIGGVPAAAAADALIALAAGMMMTQSLEMWLRARRLLAEAIAARSAPPQRGTPIVR
jgi:hypothetical protein